MTKRPPPPTLDNITPILEHIVSYIHEGVFIAYLEGTILYHNPAASELLGHPTDQPIGNLAELKSVAFNAQLENAHKKQNNDIDDFVRFIAPVDTPQGRKHIEFNTGVITLGDGETKLRLTLLSDRTEHQQLQAILHTDRKSGFVTNDPEMRTVMARIQQVANTQAAVLLQGESGTGKTQLARMLHSLSQRSDAPFVEVNCAAIPETLIESELFGHIKGAFTGATFHRTGRFLTADKGTLFLDEISEIPLHLQAKLLRAIQEQAFEPVGSDETCHVDVRIITASNHNLRDLVESNAFRADLYYRLAVIPLTIPPLRERPGDIPLLVQYFIQSLREKGYPADIKLGEAAKRLMMNYPWPGNVRELENAVEHGIICAKKQIIQPDSLPNDILQNSLYNSDIRKNQPSVDEKKTIKQALEQANGNRSVAANILGIDRSTLWRKMNKLDIK